MPIRVDILRAWQLGDEQSDLADDWFVHYLKEKDPLEKQIDWLFYLKHYRKANEYYARASEIMKKEGLLNEN